MNAPQTPPPRSNQVPTVTVVASWAGLRVSVAVINNPQPNTEILRHLELESATATEKDFEFTTSLGLHFRRPLAGTTLQALHLVVPNALPVPSFVFITKPGAEEWTTEVALPWKLDSPLQHDLVLQAFQLTSYCRTLFHFNDFLDDSQESEHFVRLTAQIRGVQAILKSRPILASVAASTEIERLLSSASKGSIKLPDDVAPKSFVSYLGGEAFCRTTLNLLSQVHIPMHLLKTLDWIQDATDYAALEEEIDAEVDKLAFLLSGAFSNDDHRAYLTDLSQKIALLIAAGVRRFKISTENAKKWRQISDDTKHFFETASACEYLLPMMEHAEETCATYSALLEQLIGTAKDTIAFWKKSEKSVPVALRMAFQGQFLRLADKDLVDILEQIETLRQQIEITTKHNAEQTVELLLLKQAIKSAEDELSTFTSLPAESLPNKVSTIEAALPPKTPSPLANILSITKRLYRKSKQVKIDLNERSLNKTMKDALGSPEKKSRESSQISSVFPAPFFGDLTLPSNGQDQVEWLKQQVEESRRSFMQMLAIQEENKKSERETLQASHALETDRLRRDLEDAQSRIQSMVVEYHQSLDEWHRAVFEKEQEIQHLKSSLALSDRPLRATSSRENLVDFPSCGSTSALSEDQKIAVAVKHEHERGLEAIRSWERALNEARADRQKADAENRALTDQLVTLNKQLAADNAKLLIRIAELERASPGTSSSAAQEASNSFLTKLLEASQEDNRATKKELTKLKLQFDDKEHKASRTIQALTIERDRLRAELQNAKSQAKPSDNTSAKPSKPVPKKE